MTTILATEKLLSYTGKRLLVRRVYEDRLARSLHKRSPADPIIVVTHGGDVQGAYGYPAETEAIVTVAFPSGDVVQWGCRLRANGVTHGGILAECLGDWARPYADGRYSETMCEKARELIIKSARERLEAYKEGQHE